MSDINPVESNGEPLLRAIAPNAGDRLTRLNPRRRSADAVTQNGSALPISPEVRALEKQIEEGHAEFETLAAEFVTRALPKAYDIGELLLDWKNELGHGKLGKNLLGLQERIGLSPRSARSYMRIAKHYEKLEQIAGDALTEMSVRAAVKLLSGVKTSTHDPPEAGKDVIDGEFEVVCISKAWDTGPPTLEALRTSQAFREFFGTALVDPWGLTHGETPSPKLSPSELRGLPVSTVLQPSSHLYFLAGDEHLTDALRTMKAWGFAFSHSLVIARNKPIENGPACVQGHYFVLCGGRTNKPFRAAQLTSWIDAAGDSMDEIRQRVELASDGPYLQVFGQSPVSNTGWTTASTGTNASQTS